jgi:hypothetical protein
MPRPRQRIVTCDCLDCKEEDDAALGPLAPDTTSSAANEAAARQEPPPKSLFIIASGLLQPGGQADALSSLELAMAPHLDKCAQQGSLNLIACRPKPHDQDAALFELQEVLGLHAVSRSGLRAGPLVLLRAEPRLRLSCATVLRDCPALQAEGSQEASQPQTLQARCAA